MGIESAVTVLAKLNLRKTIGEDDFVDVINHVITPGLLLLAATATYLTQYMGEPIHCWTPAEYKEEKNFQKYVDSFCWITDMYNVPMDSELPKSDEERQTDLVGFYRWVSVVLLLQALMFKLPNVLWMSWKGVSGVDPDRILKMALEADMDEQLLQEDDAEEEVEGDVPYMDGAKPAKSGKESKMEPLAAFIDRRLKLTAKRNRYSTFSRLNLFNLHSGSFLTYFYLFVKLLFPIIIILQFVLLSEFLNVDFFAYGIDVVSKQTNWAFWEDTGVFPRIAMCDFDIRQLQNVQTFTVQCVLSMNMFIEKIYIIQWAWLIFILVLNIIGTVQTFLDKLMFSRHQIFIRKFLTIGQGVGHFWPPRRPKNADVDDNRSKHPREIIQNLPAKEKQKLVSLIQQDSFQRMFVKEYLKPDGIFLLKCIHRNQSNMSVIDLIFRLLEYYLVHTCLVKSNGDEYGVIR